MKRTPMPRRAEPPRRLTPMPTQRQPIARVTPMPRGAGLARVIPIRPDLITGKSATIVPFPPRPPRVHAASGRPRQDPGFPREVKIQIYARDVACVLRGWAGAPVPCWGPQQPHHRKLTGSGGTSDPRRHVAAAGLLVCASHHDYAHLHRAWARELGLICDKGASFLDQPVTFDGGLTWFLLDGRDGRYVRCKRDGSPLDGDDDWGGAA
jgi:hypothetical protein